MPEFRAELVEVKGIGMATAKKIEELYPNREALVSALLDESFSIELSDVVMDNLKEAMLPPARPKMPSPQEEPDVEIDVFIRSVAGQPLDVHYRSADGKPKSLVIRPKWTRIPKDYLDVLDSPHFNDLALLGRVEVKA